MAKFRLSEIRDNPFRQVERYPLREKKIAALIGSIGRTGFWDNVLARIGPDGKPELAYGHHRLAALRKYYADKEDPDPEIELTVRQLDDAAMIRIMSDENMEEYASDFTVAMETVRAVVEAYGAVKLDLPEKPEDSPQVRFAPSFVIGNRVARYTVRPYSIEFIEVFL